MRTVRDFKNLVRSKEITGYSDAYNRFWAKLDRLGGQKATKRPGECKDIDATALLTDEEWTKLEAEFNNVLENIPGVSLGTAILQINQVAESRKKNEK